MVIFMERNRLTPEELSDLKNVHAIIDKAVQSNEPRSITINVSSNNSSINNSNNISVYEAIPAYREAATAKACFED
jgi:hypothetical protein